MRIYVIVPVNYEYDDDFYYQRGYEEPMAAFRDRAKAIERLYDLNQEARNGRERQTDNGTVITDYFIIKELDVPEDLVGGK